MASFASCMRCLARAVTPLHRPSPRSLLPASQRLYHTPRTSTLPRGQLRIPNPRPIHSYQLRHKSESTSSNNTTPLPSRLERDQVPSYELTFTCKKCSTRSSHRVSKQGYHHGTVLIACPGCKNRHLISDHMKVGIPLCMDAVGQSG